MTLGPRGRVARSAIAVAMSAVLLAGCGGDGDAEDPSDSSSTAPGNEADDPTSPTGTDTGSAEPEPAETPAIEPATGVKLKQDHAEIRLPEGWKRKKNYGVLFLRQGAGDVGSLTFTELNDAGLDDGATSLDAIAKRQLRLVDKPGIKRRGDVVMGTDTMAYKLTGMATEFFYEEYYGALIGNIEYSLVFNFSTNLITKEEASQLVDSMLLTWDFNP